MTLAIRGHIVFGVLAFVILALSGVAVAARPDTKALCAECHASSAALVKKAVVHKPVSSGECTACHNPHVSRHTGLLDEAGAALCYGCHEKKKGFEGQSVHGPVKKGECAVCHEPHSSQYRGLLKDSLSEQCFKCHKKDDVIKDKVVHPVVKKGDCTVCHDPHAAGGNWLLRKPPGKLCADCHNGKTAKAPGAHSGFRIAGSDCTSCHAAHSSDSHSMLRVRRHKPFDDGSCSSCHAKAGALAEKGQSLCLKCHKNTLDTFNKRYNHLVKGYSTNLCLDCHAPHASDVKGLMRADQETACYACHADTKAFSDSSKHRHPKVKRCDICHASHASDNRFFMRDGGTNTCITADCHPTQGKFSHPQGENILDPRSSESMDCVSCHNPMGTFEEMNLRGEKVSGLCEQCHKM
ncbi:MAG: hypothetical protein OEV59_09330 [Deltaproteobacteria bacterium]|nr:hypothetical protein [Deltaproteobacteria bacterium]